MSRQRRKGNNSNTASGSFYNNYSTSSKKKNSTTRNMEDIKAAYGASSSMTKQNKTSSTSNRKKDRSSRTRLGGSNNNSSTSLGRTASPFKNSAMSTLNTQPGKRTTTMANNNNNNNNNNDTNHGNMSSTSMSSSFLRSNGPEVGDSLSNFSNAMHSPRQINQGNHDASPYQGLSDFDINDFDMNIDQTNKTMRNMSLDPNAVLVPETGKPRTNKSNTLSTKSTISNPTSSLPRNRRGLTNNNNNNNNTGNNGGVTNKTNNNSTTSSSTFSTTTNTKRNNNNSTMNATNSTPGAKGLNNLGNTCFMNSALQCLAQVQPLTEYFLNGNHTKDINRANPLGTEGNLAEVYAELIRNMWSSNDNRSSISPNAFKKTVGAFAPRFKGFSQHDSQEFLAFLLDGLHEDLNRVVKKPYFEQKEDTIQRSDEILATELWSQHLARNKSIVQEVFHGMFKSRVRCPQRECQHTSIVFDPFMYLSLPLTSPSSSSTHGSSTTGKASGSSRRRGTGSEKSITLQQALFNFTAEEELGEDNEWYCPKCKEQRRAHKKLDIWRLPEILILHLKRFSQGRVRRSKLECMVDFPMKGLDMTPYVVESSPHRIQDNNIYDLFAVSCHSGGLGGGHYTATVQQYTTGKWIDCNDARVSDLGSDPTSTLRASAYILMYRRRKSSSNMLTNGTSTSGNVSVSKSGRVRGAML